MYIGFYSYHKLYNKNRLLTDPNSPIGDNLNYPFVLLAQDLKKLGHSTSTLDLDELQKFDAVVFLEFPGFGNPYFKKLIASGFKNIYLILLESPLISPANYHKENHIYFKKIFTWDDTIIDNKKYFKINYSHNIPTTFDFSLNKKEKLCTMISSNQIIRHPLELYTERIRAIRWFEKNHPEDFDLYGKNWNRYSFQGKILGVNIARLNRLTFLTKTLAPVYPSYKGSVASKNETFKKYKFAICYENIEGFNGYITEKIMDCFLAGCVPIYLGAKNITDHIPKNTFIDKRDFKNYEELYLRIKHMPEAEYQKYLDAIKVFLEGEKSYAFSAQCFANTIIKEIVNANP